MSTVSESFSLLTGLNMGMKCACFNLRKAARAVTQLYDRALRPTGLRATQLSLLAAIAVLEPVTMFHLARATVMDRTTLTRNLKPLDKRGLVLIRQGKDQRTRSLSLTGEGHAVLLAAYPLWEKAQTEIENGLGPEQWKTMVGSLSALIALV